AAETGHLVFGTMHSANAAQAIHKNAKVYCILEQANNIEKHLAQIIVLSHCLAILSCIWFLPNPAQSQNKQETVIDKQPLL
ncbi:MAG: hypothetical protein JSW66_04315, partial [Phycisphaerales bacterium]